MNSLRTAICYMIQMTTKAVAFVTKKDTILTRCTNIGVYKSGDEEGTCCGGGCGCENETCGC